MLAKCPTGIQGLDEVTDGGLPLGRPALVCGAAGCGKTLLAAEFLIRGAAQFGEPGVFFAFEETANELATNLASLGFDLPDLIDRRILIVDQVRVERSEIQETGEYDLEGLFIRIGYAIDSIGAKRVVLDTIEALFAGLSNEAILRSELRRLFAWLKTKGVTAVITGERGEGTLTRHGLEEYVSDCVILLDNRVENQVSTRRIRVVKYRGSTHGTNEYPFLIDQDGITVAPITGLTLEYKVSDERVSSGISRLDAMLGGKGYYRGSTILVSGTAGTGKSTLAAHFADACCRRGETCIYFAFEEARQQVVRNMRSVGMDLQPWIDQEKLRFVAARPSTYGIEMHLALMHREIMSARPSAVIVDPISPFLEIGTRNEVRTMLTRLIDSLKQQQITALCTNLVGPERMNEATECSVSSLMDTWILLREVESEGERNRGIYVLKSRGMPHSNQIREFRLTESGMEILDVYLGADGGVTGSARAAREAGEVMDRAARKQAVDRKRLIAERRTRALEAQIALLRVQIEAEEMAVAEAIEDEELSQSRTRRTREQMAGSRMGDSPRAPVRGPEADTTGGTA